MATLAHRRAGTGSRTVLLLHGLLGSARNLTTLSRRLVERDPALSVVAPDLTGHGSSPPLPPGADLATVASDVLATARALRLGEALRLAGHSLGGRVALRAGMLAPEILERIVLLDISPSPVAADETARLVTRLREAPATAASRDVFRAHFRAAGVADDVVEWLLQNLVHEAGGYRWRIDRAALADLHLRSQAEDLWPAVEGPRPYRVGCVRGGGSPYVSDTDARRLEAAGCPVETLDGAGHFLHIDRPIQLVERLLAWVG
jgi:pimeloyl-ACP methyl ester carboxylesterase